jgi:hypothetical protein
MELQRARTIYGARCGATTRARLLWIREGDPPRGAARLPRLCSARLRAGKGGRGRRGTPLREVEGSGTPTSGKTHKEEREERDREASAGVAWPHRARRMD